jgi:hypothetical protein
MENADCNVIICKGDYAEETHSNKKAVVLAEEHERVRREHDDAVKEEHSDLKKVINAEEEERKRRIQVAGEEPAEVAKFHSDLNKNVSVMAEEAERRRRLDEDPKEPVASISGRAPTQDS